MLPLTTLIFALVIALPSIHVSALPSSHAGNLLHHRAVVPRTSTAHSGKCRARPSGSASSIGSSTAASSLALCTLTSSTAKTGPATTKTIQKPTTTETSTPAAPTSTSGGYFSGSNTGDVTFYATGLNACGTIDSDGSSYITAVSTHLFDNYPGYDGNPNHNPVCNKKIKATYKGKSVTVTVTDRCAGCARSDLDMSPLAFQKLGDFSEGRLHGMTWEWV